MSYNGTGTFSINSAGQPVVTGTTITSTAFNTLTADLATGLSTALCKDGQSTPTANLGMGAFKITNLGAGTLATDAVRLSQIQSGAATFITVTAADTILGTGTPALTAYATGNTFRFAVATTNTTAVTLNIDSLGAKAVTRDGSTALVAGDLVSGSVVTVVYDGTRFQVLNSNSKTNWNLSGTLTAASTATATKFIPTGTSVTGNGMYLPTTNALAFSTNGTERVRIDASGNVGINKTPDAWISSWKAIQGGTGSMAIASGDNGMYVVSNAYRDTSDWRYGATANASYYQQVSGLHIWYTAPSGTAGNVTTFTERMRITEAGLFMVGITSASNHAIYRSIAEGSVVLVVSAYPTSNNDTAIFYGVSGAGVPSTSATGMKLWANSSTGRSLNSSGTNNASGADYAEYIIKADDCGVIAKGAIAGVDEDGKLTDSFTNAHSFVIKSTNPSFVGGDTWGSGDAVGEEPKPLADDASDEEKAQYEADKAVFDAALEAERQKVDRIAFSGQVPVNVTGATVGDYIIPVAGPDGGITGEAVASPTFDQYRIAVGRVWKILEDGRAVVSVKVS